MNRLEVLQKIDELQEQHCKTCTLVARQDNRYCLSECKIGKQISSLGDKLLSREEAKIKDIIRRGENMTTSEILYLHDCGMTRLEIARHLNIGRVRAIELINDLLEVRDMKNNYEYVKELMNQGKKPKEIVKETGLSTSTVHTYMSQIRKENDEAKAINNTEVDYKAKYEEISTFYRDLEKQRDENKKLIHKLQEELNEANEKIEELETAVEKLEEINEALKNKNDELLNESQKHTENIEQLYNNEKAKHEALLTYITLSKEVALN